MRTVTVFSTKNNKKKEYSTDVTTWGDLKSLISEDYDLQNLKATETTNKTTLEHMDSVLPEGDFRLFLRPGETKSGVDVSTMSFKELRATAKNLDAIPFLNKLKPGKNYTQLSTEDLRAGLKQFINQSSDVPATPVEATPVESASTESDPVENTPKTPIERLKKIQKELTDLRDIFEEEDEEFFEDELEHDFDRLEDDLSSILDSLKEKQDSVESVSDEDDIAKEARDLMSGFIG